MCTLGEKLKFLRNEKSLSQDKLCEMLNSKFNTNINKGMMSKWENDKEEPRMDFMRNFALFYGVSLDYLIGIKNEIQTIAAHSENENYTEEELEEIESFKKYILSKRNKKDN